MSEMDSTLIQEEATAVIIETPDKKEWRIEKKLPLKASMLFQGSYHLLVRLMPTTSPENILSAEEIDDAANRLIDIIVAANKIKNPELTKEYIEENFDEQDILACLMLYYARYVENTNRKKWSEVKPGESKGKNAKGAKQA